MSKTLTFHIIFHTKLYKDNLNGFTPDEIKNWFSWVAVNEKIPKAIPDWVPSDQLIFEYKLKNYSPFYQMLYFYQNSFFFHLLMNPELLNSRYVGFGQYDMKFNAHNFRSVIQSLENDSGDKIVGFFPYKSDGHFTDNPENEELYNKCFIEPYRKYYHISHTLSSLSKWPIFLIHTYILPTWFFKQMMEFIDWNIPTIMKSLNWNVRHLSGTLERILGLCICAGLEEGRFRSVKHIQDTQHIEEQHAGDIVRNIPEGSEHKTKI